MSLIAAYLPLLPIYIHLVVLQMGGYFSSIIEWASFGKHAQILILGLDASGKTTIINRLKTGTHAVTVPTIGFNSETIEFNNLTFHAWDIGGQDSIRKLYDEQWDDEGRGLDKESEHSNEKWFFIDNIERELQFRRSGVYKENPNPKYKF